MKIEDQGITFLTLRALLNKNKWTGSVKSVKKHYTGVSIKNSAQIIAVVIFTTLDGKKEGLDGILFIVPLKGTETSLNDYLQKAMSN